MTTTVLITGASAGLGAAFARGFAAKGCDLVLVARDKGRLEDVAADLAREFGSLCEVLPADLLDADALAAVAERLADRDRPVDILVNNAGFGLPAPFPYNPVEDEERMLDLLVKVPLRLTHALLPGLRERRRGAVLNVSSVAGLLPTGTYGAAKAWITAFSESLRVDMEPYGVRVLAVVPGFTRTEFQERAGMDVTALRDAVWLEPRDVVAKALKDLALRRPVSITGRHYRAYAVAVRHLPRAFVARKMARKRRAPADRPDGS
ncbi:SDR family NAD(P)-dependent oxidoreductase [Streptomyces sp. NPDC002812]|uniref:SDR family NAD(P)-dependent oxidoreductase n=1 Tax=unclassified Streptomyces TaxID=2593676 RepID=UPI002030D01C|nr:MULTISPECIES: SDR family NAD(P)-dependent oxidoreductase [unclassified Streptomyces]MCM1967298.1 SDR family NAD(P)-dependent oxidoreductase [Streptomyces sp. G1]MCX5127910.1 SDR family NAD(P)-dependent oxidoreductase [Streptomyces sp. NBC_00347]MCX5301423.1 SDR family NAD(P)-dependent oxidoreductase [Streptomyces sp. NBC_00193]